jgi:predicted RNase H-like HicB family nuclease
MATQTRRPNRKNDIENEAVLEPSEDGGYTVYVPALRGCVSEGDTEEEALENIKDATRVWHDARKGVASRKGVLVRKVAV